jgi:hypothetical protein
MVYGGKSGEIVKVMSRLRFEELYHMVRMRISSLRICPCSKSTQSLDQIHDALKTMKPMAPLSSTGYE